MLPFMKISGMSLIWAESISLDSTFKQILSTSLPDDPLDLDPGVYLAERLLQVLPEVHGHLHLRHGDVLERQVFVAVFLTNLFCQTTDTY